jgi:hypothetical protein
MAVSASALPTALPVVPGEEATCELKIRNTGTVVDEFTFEILGDPARWTELEPELLHLFPAADGTVTLRLNPPRDFATKAGPTPFGIKVNSKEDPAKSIVQEGSLAVGAFSDLAAELQPQVSRTRRAAEHRVSISNRGNQRLEAALSATDPDNALTFETLPPSVGVEPCGQAAAIVRVEAPKLKITGRPEPHAFQVVVQSAGEKPVGLAGTLSQRPLLPWWAILVAAVLLVVVVAFTSLKAVIVVVVLIAAGLALMPASRKYLQQLLKSPRPPSPPSP